MFKLFLNNIKIANDNIILTAPLVIFVSLFSVYISYAQTFEHTIIYYLLTLSASIIMISAFSSCWFYVVRKAIKLSGREFVYDKDRITALMNIIKSVPKGFGKLFLPFAGIVAVAFVLFFTGYNFVDYALPTKGFLQLENLHITGNEYRSIIVFCTIVLLSFWGLMWIPEVVYNERNPFKALVYSIKKILIKLPQMFCIYLFILIMFVLIQYAVIYLMINPFLYFIVLLLYYYFAIYVTILLFRYYEQTFLK